MNYQGIVIAGTEGTEIDSIARKVCEKNSKLVLSQIIIAKGQDEKTTIEDKGTLVALDQFDKMNRESKLLAKAQRGNSFYGITKKTVNERIGKETTPLFVVPSELIKELMASSVSALFKFFIIFVDSPDDLLDKRLAAVGINNPDTERRAKDRLNASSSTYIIRNADEEKTIELILRLWEYRESGGPLPGAFINLMIECGVLLENADIQNTTGAAYDLILDDEYYHNGKVKALSEKESFIKMKPGDYALVGSKEIANFPIDVAARFGLSVSLFFQGIILSNGPQIDPGFKGRLYCLLFNTSSDEVQLKRGQHYATIEFMKLFEPTTPYKGKYQNKNKISEYLQRDIPSSAIGELKKDVDALKAEKWWIKILPLTISLLAILIAIGNLIKSLLGGG